MTLLFRLHTDQTREPVRLENQFAGPQPSACWVIGGGPSLLQLPIQELAASPIPKLCINLSGTRLLRPTFWTSYDPSARFHRSIYLDPGVMKFVHRRRAMDLVPETTFKVCECPNTLLFDRDGQRGFASFLSADATGIIDWADSLLQGIDILFRLGFRVLYLAGCELRIRPAPAQLARARAAGVDYNPSGLLRDFIQACRDADITSAELQSLAAARQYHFDERKPLDAAANTDFHYFRVAQYLRLARRSLALAGLRLISVTPHSRLNDYFPYVPARRVLEQLKRAVGDPAGEPVRGLYTQTTPRTPRGLGPMRDFRPHNWNPPQQPKQAADELLVEEEGLAPCGKFRAHHVAPREEG